MSGHVRAIVLSAGKGTRMKSARPKVLHEVCGRPMLWFVLRALRDAGVDDVTVVTSGAVAEHVAAIATSAGNAAVRAVLQEPQLGTGHAVRVALAGLAARDGTLLVLNGDMPLVEATLVRAALDARERALALVTARMPLPSSFGRVVRDGAHVARVVEARDASDEELALDEMNAGLYAYDENKLRAAVAELKNDNAQGEYYLTDTIGHFARQGERIVPVLAPDYRSVLGVNDRVELAAASALLNRRLCEHHMRAGVTIVDPATTYLEPDLDFAPDVTLLPNTTIGRATRVGAHSEIGPNARLQNANIGEHVVVTDSVIVDSAIGDFTLVGPWAHVRGHAEIGTGVRIGNFVEIKSAKFAPGVKIAHLAYVGDATVGERTNIGAGTITCNYDGKKKNRTTIGADVFVGSNSSLVAPVSLGNGAQTGAGSVVIRDVAAGQRVVGNPARALPPKD
ncbi:MAG: bifunctional UDP-N-acetylglucosamine diphosphorylase/glucosamine-1-phosphate N-acetyltransferase GlmU [Candidatus Eremiobacteraeota bacterium]|nr:bifunctional UDP-N-acetylglucosamine diphosphorylase/glucosamine-1-phosphate N-acetyltransferase GlmU [Candidatus Eremiobacteraeota bacterium]